MKRLCCLAKGQFCTARIPLALAFPFDYTFRPQQFAFMDIRFTQIALNRQLAPPERQHIRIVLKQFQSLLNAGPTDRLTHQDYIYKLLREKVHQLQEIKKQAKLQLSFGLKLDSVVKSSGYYQIRSRKGTSLAQDDIQQIHNYVFSRKKEFVEVTSKPKREAISSEEQLKKDILDKMQNPSKEAIEEIKKMKISKHAQLYDRIVGQVLSIGKKQAKSSRLQPFIMVDQIKGVLSCQIKFQGQLYADDQVQFDTKWLYYVQNLESQDLKKYRKKTLFDFQFWNRGSLFPIKNFASQISHLE